MDHQIIKVCVRIPATRKNDLLEMAESWRKENYSAGAKPPGWDAKAIHKIAREKFGGLLEMFEHHQWPERGSDMMRKVQSRIKIDYGSIEKFVETHKISATNKFPGWDAKAIHEIADRKFGSLQQMFEYHKWPERNSEMTQKVQSRVKDTYGSIEKFIGKHT